MSQTIALQARTGKFSFPDVMDRVQRTQMNQERLTNAQQDNALGAMKLDEATALHNAETGYREQAAAGNPNADQALSGYPELQKKIWDAFNGMKPAEYKQAKERAFRMGEAARNVLMFKDGTPEQTQAWNDEITKLADDKIIPQEQADSLIKSGVNPLLVEQALTVEQFAKEHDSRAVLAKDKFNFQRDKEARLAGDADQRMAIQQERLDLARQTAGLKAQEIQARIDKSRSGGGKGSNEDAVARQEIKSALDNYRKNIDLTDPAEAEKYNAFRETLFKQFGYTPDGRKTKPRALGGDTIPTTTRAVKTGRSDNYPIGATATGPNGEKLKKTERGWEPI